MRYIAKVDSNQREIVEALRAMGASVYLTHQVGSGFPDIVVGYRGMTILLEIKSEKGKMKPDEVEFFQKWKGCAFVVYSAEEAIMVVQNVVSGKEMPRTWR